MSGHSRSRWSNHLLPHPLQIRLQHRVQVRVCRRGTRRRYGTHKCLCLMSLRLLCKCAWSYTAAPILLTCQSIDWVRSFTNVAIQCHVWGGSWHSGPIHCLHDFVNFYNPDWRSKFYDSIRMIRNNMLIRSRMFSILLASIFISLRFKFRRMIVSSFSSLWIKVPVGLWWFCMLSLIIIINVSLMITSGS